MHERGMPVSRKRLGLIINPIAGMGGRVGLKGTDGAHILKLALQLGARPEAPKRAMAALEVLFSIKDEIELLTYPGDMGENQANAMGFSPVVLGTKAGPHSGESSRVWELGRTTSEDTEQAALDMLRAEVDLILFAGGDGTARNIFNAVGDKVPVLGVPAGVKIHSSVYATSPRDAGHLVARYLKGQVTLVKDAEVMDLDEDAFREGRVTAKLYGYLRVPYEEHLVQNLKSGSTESELAALDGIADRIIEEMEPGMAYIIGPGTTTRPIMEKLGLAATLLGVDVVLNKRLLIADANEGQLLQLLDDGKFAQIIVTVIGGQGYVFGRGNQQLSPEVIRKVGKDNIRIIATRGKLNALNRRPLLVDTGDDELNQMLKGYYRVLVSYDREVMYRIG
jgi:predicted polyphosphate/ATP-dependent NAD kinase